MDIELIDVSFAYPSGRGAPRRALRDISLRVQRGRVLGIIGPEGSGKSTLVCVMGGLLRPERGVVTIGGDDPWHSRNRLRGERARIGISLQFPGEQFLCRTVREELRFGREEMPDEEWTAALSAQGLSPVRYQDRSPFDLSMGEARRVILASLLIRKPEILLLDEPTVGLDGFGAEVLLRVLQEQVGRGTALAIVSHDLDFLSEIATDIVGLSEGRLVLSGSVASVFSSARELVPLGYDPPEILVINDELARAGLIPSGLFHRPSEIRNLVRRQTS